MRVSTKPRCHTPAFLAVLLLMSSSPIHTVRAQNKPQPEPQGGIFRVRVGLVQVDLTIFDRQGNFLDNLSPDQIELLVDGEPQPISFLELITTSGPKRPAASAPGKAAPSAPPAKAPAPAPATGRSLLFFLDDWHLSAESTVRSREALARLIEENMGPNDRGAIFTASRQLGFMQQVTDSKEVLLRALSRLRFANNGVVDLARPQMSESQALAIEQGDPDLLQYFTDSLMSLELFDSTERGTAEEIVRSRAAGIARMSAEITARTLASLRNIVRSCAVLPGRKVMFVLSDGFVLQAQTDDVVYRIQRVTEAALNAGVVIYAMDTRGLMVGLQNASMPSRVAAPLPPRDPSIPFVPQSPGILDRGFSDVLAAQDGLNALASDTGGRLIKNTNAIESSIVETLEETSRYYLLGWYMDPGKLENGRYSAIKVAVKGHPDFKVNLRQDSLNLSRLISDEKERAALARPKNDAGKELSMALQYPWPIDGIPISLFSGFAFHEKESEYVLDISLQADLTAADPAYAAKQDAADIDLLGIVANRDGNPVGSFEISAAKPEDPGHAPRVEKGQYRYGRIIAMEPGLYQVRVAVRDRKSGTLGSAHQWVEIPQTTPGKAEISSVYLRRLPEGPAREGLFQDVLDEATLNPGRRYPAGSRLPFSIQVFNAVNWPVTIETRIYRGNQVMLQSDKLTAPGEAGAIPLIVSGEVALGNLPPGSYAFEVTMTDPLQQTQSTRRVGFWIQ